MSGTAYKVVAVDDNAASLAQIVDLLHGEGYQVEAFTSGDEAIARVKEGREQYALGILDYRMEGKNGAETNRELLQIHPKMYTFFLSAADGRKPIKEAWYSGARAFVEKGDDAALVKEARIWYYRYVEDHAIFANNAELLENEIAISQAGLVGCSPSFLKVIKLAQKFSGNRMTVRVEGETGVGKERIARLMHQGRPETFFAVNCADFQGGHELMQSELFGYVRGAFTGADRDKKGIFEAATGGTVFLDEIDTLELAAQEKLLRVLREKHVRPLGATREFPIEFRLIVASKPHYEKRIVNATVKPDFYERVNVLVLSIPPLRERPEDIPLLVNYFSAQWEHEHAQRKTFLLGAIDELRKYSWPRNVAQLEHVVQRLCANTEIESITRKDVKMVLAQSLDAPQPNRGTFQESRLNHILNVTKNCQHDRISLRGLSRLTKIPYTTLYRDAKKLGLHVLGCRKKLDKVNVEPSQPM